MRSAMARVVCRLLAIDLRDPVEDEDGEENVGVAAHEAYPAGLAFEDHEYGEVDDAGGERCQAADESAEGDGAELCV